MILGSSVHVFRWLKKTKIAHLKNSHGVSWQLKGCLCVFLDLTDSADLQPQECQSSFVLEAFIYLLIYFISFYSYCDTAVCNRKVFGVGIVLIYTHNI